MLFLQNCFRQNFVSDIHTITMGKKRSREDGQDAPAANADADMVDEDVDEEEVGFARLHMCAADSSC